MLVGPPARYPGAIGVQWFDVRWGVSDPDDGPWDRATDHDHPGRDKDALGEDPPTMPATLAQRAVARAARPQPSPMTLPPPANERLPAKRMPASAHEQITPVASPAVTEAALRASRADSDITKPAVQPAVARAGTSSGEVVLLDTVSRNSPRPAARTDTSVVIVASGRDAERMRRLCATSGLLVPIASSLSVVADDASVIVIGEPSPPAPERVVHVARPTQSDEMLLALVRAFAGGRVVVDPPVASPRAEPRVHDLAQRLGALDDRGAIESLASEATAAIAGADRAQLVFHDPQTGALWSEAKRAGSELRRSTCGIVGWCAHTGQAVHASPAGDDPRYVTAFDDPDGKPQSRLLVQPVIGADRRVHALLVAARRWRRSDFSETERGALGDFAALIAAALDAVVGSKRKSRPTLPGIASARPNSEIAAQSAIVAAPRTTGDSRPPPVTVRPATTPAGTFTGMPAATVTPEVNEAATTLTEMRAAPTTFTGVPPGPSPASSAATTFGGLSASAIATAAAASGSGSTAAPNQPASTLTGMPAAPAGPASSAAHARHATGETPAVRRPTQETPPQRAGSEPPAAGKRPSGEKRAATEPGEGRRPRSPSESLRAKRAASGIPEPRDVAVVATHPDDIARIQKLARKTRLEVSVLSSSEEVPQYYRIVTVGEAWTPDSDPRVAYAARSTLTDDQVSELLAGIASERAPAALSASKAQSTAEARRLQPAFASLRKLVGAGDDAEAEAITVAAVRELLDADRAYCLYFDADSGALWSELRRRATYDDRRAIAGITGWVARTGRAVNAPRASADPRWLGPLDDPDGDPHSQLLVQPLISVDRRVLGVLVAVRRPKRPGFGELEVSLLSRFAALAGPLFEQLELALDTQRMLNDTSAPHEIPAFESPLQRASKQMQRLPRWSYAVGGAALTLLITLLNRC